MLHAYPVASSHLTESLPTVWPCWLLPPWNNSSLGSATALSLWLFLFSFFWRFFHFYPAIMCWHFSRLGPRPSPLFISFPFQCTGRLHWHFISISPTLMISKFVSLSSRPVCKCRSKTTLMMSAFLPMPLLGFLQCFWMPSFMKPETRSHPLDGPFLHSLELVTNSHQCFQQLALIYISLSPLPLSRHSPSCHHLSPRPLHSHPNLVFFHCLWPSSPSPFSTLETEWSF